MKENNVDFHSKKKKGIRISKKIHYLLFICVSMKNTSLQKIFISSFIYTIKVGSKFAEKVNYLSISLIGLEILF